MTDDEFDRWIKAHTAAFPGMWRWLQEAPGTLAAWKECLQDVPFTDARQATRDMNRGDSDAPAFGEHARTVRRLARVLAFEAEQQRRKELPAGVNGGPRHHCAACQDSGIVIVADIYVRPGGSAPIRKFLDGQSPHLPRCGVFCICASGRGRNPQYDERVMFALSQAENTSEDIDGFRKWWSEGMYLPNRVTAFDRYNAGGDI